MPNIDPGVLAAVGMKAATVLAVLVANDMGEGAQLTHKEIVQGAGIPYRTTRRCLDKLRDAGLLTWEAQYRDDGQQANLYQIPTGTLPAEGNPDPCPHVGGPLSKSGQPIGTPSISLDTHPKESLDVCDLPSGAGAQSAALRAASVAAVGPEEFSAGQRLHAWPHAGEPLPFPTRSSGPGGSGRKWARLSETCRQADWLVTYFHGFALPRLNAEREAKDWKTVDSVDQKRLAKWHESAVKLVQDHPLAEVVEIVDWVFVSCQGYLPESAVEKSKDRKLTRLRQVLNSYDALLEAMTAGIPPAPVKPMKRREPPDEAVIDELVAQFAEFRAALGDRRVPDGRRASWAKTFRIMLWKHSLDDIKAVLEALHECPEHVDQWRYKNAYDLNRNPEEWARLQGYVEIHRIIKARKAAQPQVVVPSAKADDDDWRDEDDDWRPRLSSSPRPGGQASDFSSPENIKLRRLRYAARKGNHDRQLAPATAPPPSQPGQEDRAACVEGLAPRSPEVAAKMVNLPGWETAIREVQPQQQG